MVAAGVPVALLIVAANYNRYQSLFWEGYRGHGFSNPLLVGLYGILFSAGKSVFLFSPPLILGFLGWRKFLDTPHGRKDGVFFFMVFLAQLVIYSKWFDWSGDDSWGVRFLIPGVMLMTIPLIELLDSRKVVLIVASVGVFVQLLAVLVSGLQFTLILHEKRLTRQALYVDGRSRIDFEDMRYNPQYSQIVGHWILVRTLLGMPPKPREPREEKKVGTSLYDTMSPEEWRDVAGWDFIWFPKRKAGSQ
jgi:hypothetical protein